MEEKQEIQILTACDGHTHMIISDNKRFKFDTYVEDNPFTNEKILPKKVGVYRLTIKIEVEFVDPESYIQNFEEVYTIIKIEVMKKAEFEIYVDNPKSQRKVGDFTLTPSPLRSSGNLIPVTQLRSEPPLRRGSPLRPNDLPSENHFG